MTAAPVFTRLRGRRTVPAHLLAATAAASAAAVAFGVIDGWALWVLVLAALLPWVPVVAFEIAWTYHHYGWLALFYVLVITQVGHVVEHVCQMLQLHVWHLHASEAEGVFGQLNVEWVHFAWNTWVLVALVALAVRFGKKNVWLLAAIVVAGWHQLEHTYIMSVFLRTGVEGTPGILAEGGLLGGVLGVPRPELHFLYNVVETLPIIAAFVFQLRRTHDAWLARAFPGVPEEELSRVTPRLRTVRLPAGATIVAADEVPRGDYVLVRGSVEVVRAGGDGARTRTSTLGPGRRLCHANGVPVGAVRAQTPVELLALDEATALALGSRGSATTPSAEASDELPEALRALRARLAR